MSLPEYTCHLLAEAYDDKWGWGYVVDDHTGLPRFEQRWGILQFALLNLESICPR